MICDKNEGCEFNALLKCTFISAKSLGIIIGGQLTEVMTLPEIFQASSYFALTAGTLWVLTYHLFGKKREKQLVQKLNEKYPLRCAADRKRAEQMAGGELNAIHPNFHMTSL